MKKQFSGFAIGIIILILMPFVTIAAPVVYTYTGNSFDTFIDSPLPTGSYDTTNYLEIILTTVDGYLPDMSSGDITPYLDSWFITDGRTILTNSDNTRFVFIGAQVDSGEITEWSFVFEHNNSNSDPTFDPTLPGARMTSNGLLGDSATLIHWFGTSYSRDKGTFSSVGAWEVRGNVIPEPTTMLLFGTGIAGLAAVGRRKK